MKLETIVQFAGKYKCCGWILIVTEDMVSIGIENNSLQEGLEAGIKFISIPFDGWERVRELKVLEDKEVDLPEDESALHNPFAPDFDLPYNDDFTPDLFTEDEMN